MLANFCRCRTAADLSLNRWGFPAPRRVTQFGSLFHLLLQRWYSSEQVSLAAVWQTTAKEWERLALKGGDDVRLIQEDLGMAKVLFPGYVNHWRKADRKKKWIELEQVFDLPFVYNKSGDMIRLRGKIDGVYEAKDRSVWVLETKTASEISHDTLNMALAYDFQNLFYIHALEQKLGRRISGVLYNVIRKPQIGKKTDRTSQTFCDTLTADMEKRGDFYFARFELPYSPKTREIFRHQLKDKVKDFVAWVEGKIPTYRNESVCRGRWNCGFMAVCAAGGDPERAGFKQNHALFSELIDEA